MVNIDDVVNEEIFSPRNHFNPEYVNTKVSSLDMTVVRDVLRSKMQARNDYMLAQSSARIKIESDYPITVFAWGDQHYGSCDSDHDRIHREFDYFMETPGVYVFQMGNPIDNAIPKKFPDGMLQNGIPPEQQVVAWSKISRDLDAAGKMLGVVEAPCHEGWTYAATGQDINRLLFDYEGRQFPIMENGGKLILELNGIEYRFAMYHQTGPFNSNLNKNNATKRMRELQHSNADVVAAAHHHVGEAMQTYVDKGEDQRSVVYLRTGCYKLDDRWAGGKGYIKGEPGGQSVTLWHNEKRMQANFDVETAIEMHTALALYHKVARRIA